MRRARVKPFAQLPRALVVQRVERFGDLARRHRFERFTKGGRATLAWGSWRDSEQAPRDRGGIRVREERPKFPAGVVDQPRASREDRFGDPLGERSPALIDPRPEETRQRSAETRGSRTERRSSQPKKDSSAAAGDSSDTAARSSARGVARRKRARASGVEPPALRRSGRRVASPSRSSTSLLSTTSHRSGDCAARSR